jgi:glucose/mannose-6-phosphate isomerase
VTTPEPERLDDLAAVQDIDSSDMLRVIAGSAAQVRASLTSVRGTSLSALSVTDRPRAVVMAGMGGSGIAGEVLAAVAGRQCPVPVIVHRDYGLPGWVGAADLVVAVSCSGTTQETLSSVAEASRRGARLLGVGTAGSPLDEECQRGGGAFVPVVKQLSPRSSLWALAVPGLVVAARLRLLDLGPDDGQLEAAAVRLESVASACRPDREWFVNPAKTLAVELSGSLPMLWGSGQVGPVAATRAACQLAENAKLPAVVGDLPEAHHNQVVTFDGPLAGGNETEDLFRDRVEQPDPMRLRLVLLRDSDDGDATTTRRAEASADLASARGVPTSVLVAEGDSPVERLASLVALVDYASAYLALLHGVDPTPITPIDELKRALA